MKVLLFRIEKTETGYSYERIKKIILLSDLLLKHSKTVV